MAEFRVMVNDVSDSVAFWCDRLGFEPVQQFGPNMAIIRRGDATVWLAGPHSSAGRPMPDGARPGPGGWNRVVLKVADIEAEVARLRDEGVSFRNDIVSGPGGRQILCQDPSGNLIELFQPA